MPPSLKSLLKERGLERESRSSISKKDAIALIEEHKLAPENGAYSFSTTELCPLSYKFYKVDKIPGPRITRFGTDVGGAKHILAEYDIQMRMTKSPEEWISASNMVDRLVRKQPEHLDRVQDLTESLQKFRFNFETNPKDYMASEMELGCDFMMNPVPFDNDMAWFRGVCDYVEVNNGIARLVDYKNYPTIHADREINNMFEGVGYQLAGYGALLMAMFPQITGFYYEVYYFRYGVSKRPYYTDEDGNRKLRIISRDEIENWWDLHQRKMLSFELLEEYPAKPAKKKCQYCDYVDRCDWFLKEKVDADVIISGEEDAHDKLKQLIVLEEQRARLRDALKTYTADIAGSVESEDYFFGYKEVERTSINNKIAIDLCREAGIDPAPFVNVSPSKIDKLRKVLTGDTLQKLEESIIIEKKTRLDTG